MASISGARYAEFRQASEANGPIMVIPDATLLPNVNVPRVPEEEQTRSIISIGLIHNEKMIGALNVATQGNIHIPSDKEQELVQAFANQAAVAIANAQLFEQVSASKQSLEMLSQRLVEIQEVERRYLARELHDEIGQLLTSLSLTLNILARESGDIQPSSRAEEELGRAQEVVSQLLKQVRELSLDLRPALLDDLGLLPALLSHFERYNAQTGIRVDFRHSGLEERCSGQVETTAFRIIQEALTNVARHAKVDEVAVRLWANEDTLGVQVEDEGIGFDPQAALQRGGTVGLSGMRERVALCGGHMEISSEPGSGTSLTAELPLNSRL
jgi:signal transduction histidine kinase